MSIKVEINITENKLAEFDYPFIGISTSSSVIVLFGSKRKGIVLDKNDSTYKVGYMCETWDMNCFVELKGTITLSNN